MVVTYRSTQKCSGLPRSEEAKLLDLLCKVETGAYALAHAYDVGGYTSRAYRLIGITERLRDAVVQIDELVQAVEPRSKAPVRGLRSRAHSLRGLLRNSTWASSSAPPRRRTLRKVRRDHVAR
jgi:hypothetical protein